jgi:cytochrome c biogenesis protein CcdA
MEDILQTPVIATGKRKVSIPAATVSTADDIAIILPGITSLTSPITIPAIPVIVTALRVAWHL